MNRWIIKQNDEVGCTNCQCPACKEEFFFPRINVEPYKFCPNCGADMRQRDESELAIEQAEHDAFYEPTFNPEDGSM